MSNAALEGLIRELRVLFKLHGHSCCNAAADYLSRQQPTAEDAELVKQLSYTMNDCPPSYRSLMHQAASRLSALSKDK